MSSRKALSNTGPESENTELKLRVMKKGYDYNFVHGDLVLS